MIARKVGDEQVDFTLCFLDNYNQVSTVKEWVDEEVSELETALDMALDEIKLFCAKRGFRVPYFRYWNTKDSAGESITQIDAGSHSEFFFTKPPLFDPTPDTDWQMEGANI